MSGDTVGFIRSEGRRLLRALYRELFMNLSGKKAVSELAGIYTAHRELMEPDLFISFRERAHKEEGPGGRLISSFLADAFLSGNTSAAKDRILAMEAGEEFTASGKKITIRNMKARILSEPRKAMRDEIESGSRELLNRLNPLYRQHLERLAEYSEILGYGSYGNLLEAVHETDIAGLAEEARRFLKDTDYIAGDMLNWFSIKKLELKPKDANYGDVIHLLNSAELRGYFPKIDLAAYPRIVLRDMGLTLPSEVGFDTEKRKGKAADGFSVPLNPPFEAAVSIYPVGGIQDYESLFNTLGACLCFAFTEPDDDFEFLFLRDETLTGIFSSLFTNLLYEPRWLRKYLKLDPDKNFLDFLSLRRLMSARLDAGRALYAGELFGSGDPREMPGEYSRIMGDALKCRIDANSYLAESLIATRTLFTFKALYTEPPLRAFMRESFDEEWWRAGAAGDFLRVIWSEGGRMTGSSLLTRCGFEAAGSKTLVRDFEVALG